jgi:hypothetical protein
VAVTMTTLFAIPPLLLTCQVVNSDNENTNLINELA